MKSGKLIDPRVLARLSNMRLRARTVVEGFIAGLHQSPFRGSSLDFAHHREYVPGDEPRNLDWKIFARTDRYFVKQFQEETNLKAYIFLDSSASMGYASQGISKLQYAIYLASALAYLIIRQKDSVGLALFDERLKDYIPPRSCLSHLSVIFRILENTSASKSTRIKDVLTDFGKHIKRRGLIIVISDFMDDEYNVLESLRYYRYRKHEVIVFHVLDPAELEFPFNDMVNFHDSETGEQMLTYPDIIRDSYKEQMSRFIEHYKLKARESDIDYWQIDTSVPLDFSLGAYLSRRQLIK